MEAWADGHFTGATTDQTALQTANAAGQCEVLKTILSIELEQLIPEQTDE